MKRRSIVRNALNLGTAVYLGGARVRFIWACDCKHVQTVKSPMGPLSDTATALLVKNWRLNGVTLGECKLHPTWYSRISQVSRLNAENPPRHGGTSEGGMNERPPIRPPRLGRSKWGETHAQAYARWRPRWIAYRDYCVVWDCMRQARTESEPSVRQHFRAFYGVSATEIT